MKLLNRLLVSTLALALGCSIAAASGESMSQQENGIASDVVFAPTLGIVSTTAANPTQVTVTAHGLTTGDTVSIKAHQINTLANGVWTVTRTGANTFTIPVDTSAASPGGATGTIQSLAVGATYAIPSDGDAAVAASVDVALQTIGDRSAFLATATGSWKLVTDVEVILNDANDINQDQWDSFTFSANNTYTALAGATAWSPGGVFVNPGDLLEVDFSSSLSTISAGAVGSIGASAALFLATAVPGGAFAAASKMQGSAVAFLSSASSNNFPLRLIGRYLNSGFSQVIPKVTLRAAIGSTVGISMAVFGDYAVNFKVWRPTSMPQ